MPALFPAVFLDRDGVLNRTVVRDGVTHPPDSLAEFELLPGVPEACARLAAAGWRLVVVTNQPDVARGLQSRENVEEIHAHLRTVLPLDDIRACYHDGPDQCDCRKPRPGMLLSAARELDLDLQRSFLVGDRWSDVVAGQSAGCVSLLVETPYSGRAKCQPSACVPDLSAAADWICRRAG
jgi:D-glycero-D-manno-heptose 1,7-bisphosphate phosphatase